MRSKLSLLLAGLVAVALAGCGSATAEKAALPERPADAATVGVHVVQPSTQLDGNLVTATGRLRARNEATLSAKASGTIAAVLVDVGQKVKKGQPLLRLDDTQARIQVQQATAGRAVAQAAFDAARQDVERARQLRASGGVAQAGLDRAEAGFKQAEAGLAQATAGLRAAQKNLADHTLVAPFSGVITAKMKNAGEYVAMMPPTAVLGLTDVDDLEVVLPVPETVIAAVKPGAVVRGVVNPSGKPFEAKVRTVGEVVDQQARTVEVRADLQGERSAEMRPYAIVQVDFSQGDAMNGLFLPASAVKREGEKQFVWVVQAGKVARRDIGAELVTPGVVRVATGLEAGTDVVADAGAGLKDGLSVQVVR